MEDYRTLAAQALCDLARSLNAIGDERVTAHLLKANDLVHAALTAYLRDNSLTLEQHFRQASGKAPHVR